MINAHGSSRGISNRSIDEIAEHISIIGRATGEDSGVKKVSLVTCSLGEKYAIKLLPKLREQGISDAKVSVRLFPVMVLLDGEGSVSLNWRNILSVSPKLSALTKTFNGPCNSLRRLLP
jgi:hypothetical protein